MGELLRKPYEISIWEEEYISDGNYYKENKIAVIGSNTMDSPNKVYDPVLTENMNGEVTLTFSLKYKYYDPISEKEIINPFESFLVNERKVKLYYNNKWYDFIIKSHSESSNEYEWTYTCNEAFILELSKNGYNVEFDQELNNNQGTAVELAQKTLENTDWEVDEEKCDVGPQEIEEAIYHGKLKNKDGIEIIKVLNEGEKSDDSIPETLPEGGLDIYVFYGYIANKNGKFVQFILKKNSEDYTYDDKNNIIATNFRIVNELVYEEDKDTQGKITGRRFKDENGIIIITINDLETQHHAYRRSYSQLTTYDPITQRTVDVFDVAPDRTAYKYTDYQYSTSDVVVSYVSNGDTFNTYDNGDIQGWSTMTPINANSSTADDNVKFNEIKMVTRPSINLNTSGTVLGQEIEGFLEAKFAGTFNDYKYGILNTGIIDNAAILGSISQGQEFVLRWRAGHTGEVKEGPVLYEVNNAFKIVVAKYNKVEQKYGSTTYDISEIDKNGIIMTFSGTGEVLNNYITGGTFDISAGKKINYKIDNVIQEPSVKYIYKVDGDNNDYIWKKDTHEYVIKTSDNFINYRYLTATAEKTVTAKDLEDPTFKIGIFVFLNTNTISYYYYIQDIQLTKCIRDETGEPIALGNIPTAQSIATDYYYLKPKDGAAANEVETYTNLKAFADGIGLPESAITPKYNEKSEKILSISESKSNCFNVLQTIAETFQVWLNIDVEHNTNGSLTLDETTHKPNKKIYFTQFSGNDNFAGFKYGINLNSIERTVESDEFVTKLIVDPAQSEYNDNGVVTIQLADANPTGESCIYNFNYYYNQKMLDRESHQTYVENFNREIKELNNNINEEEEVRRQLEASLTQITSKRNVFAETVDTARDLRTNAILQFKDATGVDFSKIEGQDITTAECIFLIVPKNTAYNESLSYFYKSGDEWLEYDGQEGRKSISEVTVNTEEGAVWKYNPPGNVYTKLALADNETIVDIIGQIYVNSAVIQNYSGLVTNINQEYKKVREQLYGKEEYTLVVSVVPKTTGGAILKVYLSEYVDAFSFKYRGDTYKATTNVKTFDLDYVEGYNITDITLPLTYQLLKGDEVVTTITPTPNQFQQFILRSTITTESCEDKIKKLQEQKVELLKDFYNKNSRFIQEGNWNSSEYIDHNLYYLDALQVSNNSAQPKVSYTIDVAEISQLEGLENYTFNVGDKTYVEDEEFFGWNTILGQPAREEVIVSEAEWHLDDPSNNKITVQNYKTQFEDLFQRLSATVQTVQYNEATYAKTTSIIDEKGTLNPNMLIESLNNIRDDSFLLTSDGSIKITQDSILVKNLTNPLNRVMINSEGIRISSDGGVNWSTAISGRGINIGEVFAGSINTDKISIGGKENPSFRWDKNGISAFSKKTEGEEAGEYNLNTFVRFDQYGLYGIKDGDAYIAKSLADIKRMAHFGITWDGFFIRSSHADGGRVEITSDNDIQVIDGSETSRIQIGMLEEGTGGAPNKYGIVIRNKMGEDTFYTDDDKGDLHIIGKIEALGGNFKDLVTVGKNSDDQTSPWIEIDGRSLINGQPHKPTIKTSNYQPGAGSGWLIDSDGDAVFNNITARGAIKTAVFEYAEIQAVGGVFLFRPSSTIRSAILSGNDLHIEVENPLLFERGSWCKVSNYHPDTGEGQSIIVNNGLTHVYEISDITNNVITLKDAAEMVGPSATISSADELIGGALVDMGNKKEDPVTHKIGTNNYGIGINSSDNTVNLPARTISLFETLIDETKEPKVTYDYKGILGTLPALPSNKVDSTIYNGMIGTQGIYTDNMYIGDAERYLAFYTSGNTKKLKIKASELTFEGSGGNILQHFYFNTEGTESFPAGAYITNSSIDTFKTNKSGGYVHIDSKGFTLANGDDKYIKLSAEEEDKALKFYKVKTEDDEDTDIVAAELSLNGLNLIKGAIKLGKSDFDSDLEPGFYVDSTGRLKLSATNVEQDESGQDIPEEIYLKFDKNVEEDKWELSMNTSALFVDKSPIIKERLTQVFQDEPTVPYYAGDLWIKADLTYSYELTGDTEVIKKYELTEDTEIDPEKTYYERKGQGTTEDPYRYDPVTNPVVEHIDEYYEFEGYTSVYYVRQYVLSEDIEVDEDKIYYIYDGEKYIQVENPSGNPHENGYYELTYVEVLNPVTEDIGTYYNYIARAKIIMYTCGRDSDNEFSIDDWAESTTNNFDAINLAEILREEIASGDVSLVNTIDGVIVELNSLISQDFSGAIETLNTKSEEITSRIRTAEVNLINNNNIIKAFTSSVKIEPKDPSVTVYIKEKDDSNEFNAGVKIYTIPGYKSTDDTIFDLNKDYYIKQINLYGISYNKVNAPILSEDTEVDFDKLYYSREGQGTIEDPYRYILIVNPTGNPSSKSWYESVKNPSINEYYERELGAGTGRIDIYGSQNSSTWVQDDAMYVDTLYVQNLIPRNIKVHDNSFELKGNVGWVARENGHYTLKTM